MTVASRAMWDINAAHALALVVFSTPAPHGYPAPLPAPRAAVMTDAFRAIWDIHETDGLPLRTCAFVKALQRVTRARIHRGFD